MIDWVTHLIEELGLLAVIMWAGWDCLMYLSAEKHGVIRAVNLSDNHHLEHQIVSYLGMVAGALASVVFAIHLGVELSPNHEGAPINGWERYVEITAYILAVANYKLVSRHFRCESLEDRRKDYYND